VIQVGQKYAPSPSCSTCSVVLYIGGIVDSVLVKEHEGLTADGTNDYGNAWLKQRELGGFGPLSC
jgi:peptide/nickel transport system substrate-binding protein